MILYNVDSPIAIKVQVLTAVVGNIVVYSSNSKRAVQYFPLPKSCKIEPFCVYETTKLLSPVGLPEDAGKRTQVFPELTVTRRSTGLVWTASDWHAVGADADVTVCLPGLLMARL